MAECKFSGETDKSMIKIMAVTSHSGEFVEFGITERPWWKIRGPLFLWSLPQWLKDNGIKTNHDFFGNGKLCNPNHLY